MNTIDIFIKKVISVTPHTIAAAYANKPWAKGKEFLDVVVLEDAYGTIRKNHHLWERSTWKEIERRGYYVG